MKKYLIVVEETENRLFGILTRRAGLRLDWKNQRGGGAEHSRSDSLPPRVLAGRRLRNPRAEQLLIVYRCCCLTRHLLWTDGDVYGKETASGFYPETRYAQLASVE
ncbi:MAG TPA: hypothetical protein VEW46_13645 [Pyrinomonadaceae bacterium]|nr:hypothetical protein [Pyrinomonadaceae bacterium]